MKRNFSESHIEPLIFRLNNPKISAVEKAQRDIFSNWIKNLDLPKNSTALSVSIGDRIRDYLTFMEKSIKKIVATDIVDNPVRKDEIKILNKLGKWQFKKVK